MIEQPPWVVLEVPENADEATVRARYLELIRQFRPDTHPERFAAIHAAYEELRSEEQQWARRLFDAEVRATPESILQLARDQARNRRLPTRALLAIGRTAPQPPGPQPSTEPAL